MHITLWKIHIFGRMHEFYTQNVGFLVSLENSSKICQASWCIACGPKGLRAVYLSACLIPEDPKTSPWPCFLPTLSSCTDPVCMYCATHLITNVCMVCCICVQYAFNLASHLSSYLLIHVSSIRVPLSTCPHVCLANVWCLIFCKVGYSALLYCHQ